MLKPDTFPKNDIDVALETVIDMAFQGAVDKYDCPSEYRRQMAAIRLIRETFCRSGEQR